MGDVAFTVYLDAELYGKLKGESMASGLKMTEIIRLCLRAQLDGKPYPYAVKKNCERK